MAILICENCGKPFKTYRLTDHGHKRRFCNWKCAMKAPWNTSEKKGDRNVSKRLEVRKKMSESAKKIFGKRRYNWKGNMASYGAKHTWMITNFGTPKVCESCNKKGLSGHQIHWANKDHKYRRRREDWLRLCAPCHAIFDKMNRT